MNLPILSTAAQTMSSREIAELTGKRHDNVVRDIRQMLESLDASILSHEEYQEVKDDRGYTAEFRLNKSLTLTLITGYDVNRRHKINVRWMELEQQASQPTPQFNIPTNLPEALRLAADLADQVEQQQARLTVAEPKAAGFDRITQSQGELCLRDAAKTLGIPERKFTQWLIDRRWIYRDQSQTLRPYADRVRSGHLAERISTPRQTVQGEKVFAQTIVTPAGLARLGAMAERQGKLTVVGGVA